MFWAPYKHARSVGHGFVDVLGSLTTLVLPGLIVWLLFLLLALLILLGGDLSHVGRLFRGAP
jgi:hypothetical protein